MNAPANRATLVVLLIVAFGCNNAAAPTPTATAPPTPGTTPTVTPTVAPSPAELSGTVSASIPEVPEWASGGFPAYGALQVGDARADGQNRVVINWGADDPAHDGVGIWGLSDTWNAGGTWDGPWTGWITGGGDHVIDGVWAGSGQYAGLAMSYHAEAPRNDSVWQATISIGPAPDSVAPVANGEVAHVTGTRSCIEAPITGAGFPPENVSEGRGEFWLCTWDVSDDRLAGVDSTLSNVDTKTGGAADGWGSISLRSSTGASDDAFCGWLGSYSLHAAADGSITVLVDLTGLGTCEGLSYSGQESGSGNDRTVDGTISGAATGPAPTPSPTPHAM